MRESLGGEYSMTSSASRRSSRRLWRTLGLFVVATGVFASAGFRGQQPVFRSVVDLIAVDVQVVDPDGNPVEKIGPERFEVSINGQKRKVVSAQFIRHNQGLKDSEPVPVAPPSDKNPSPEPTTGRTFILAIDSGSFTVGSERAAIEAARAFVDHLDPDDRLGLYVYPIGTQVAPTTTRATVRAKLENIVGEKQYIPSHYHLKPFEVVDITAQSTNPNSFLTSGRGSLSSAALDPVLKIQQRECPGDTDCPIRIYSEGVLLATELEHQSEMSLGGLQTLLRTLADIPGRKSVVIVSAGVLVSDRLDGRPDVGDVGKTMGQNAARANANVYTLHIDAVQSPISAAVDGSGDLEFGRDRALYGNWLNQFSAAAGGKLIYVPVGRPDYAFDRVLRETSAYYLLGVEPAQADRDGRPRELKVKVDQRGVTVRNRQWVVIPAKS